MGKQVPRGAFDSIAPMEIQKGRMELLTIQPWVRNGFAYLSLGIMDLQENGSYAFLRRKGFALTVREAEELVLKLAAQVFAVKSQMYRLLDEEDERDGSGERFGNM